MDIYKWLRLKLSMPSADGATPRQVGWMLRFTGKTCPYVRQRLAAPQIGAAQQEQVVDATLILTGFLLTVDFELLAA